jgi:YVTN family beta-propeller protein
LAEDLALAPSALHGVTTVALGASPVATAALPDGSRIYVANANGSVTVIASATLTVKTNIPLGGAGQQIGASTDSTRVAVTTTGPDVLQVIDTTTDTLNASHALAGPPRALLIF